MRGQSSAATTLTRSLALATQVLHPLCMRQRSQNDFVKMELLRLEAAKQRTTDWCVCVESITCLDVSSVTLSRLCACAVWSRKHPDVDSAAGLVAWHETSRCAAVADEFNSWEWRRACIETLFLAATVSKRSALLDPGFAGVYNIGHMKRWCGTLHCVVFTAPSPFSHAKPSPGARCCAGP